MGQKYYIFYTYITQVIMYTLFFMMYNIGLNIGPNILLFVTH
jgi:hypothetical protein